MLRRAAANDLVLSAHRILALSWKATADMTQPSVGDTACVVVVVVVVASWVRR